MRTGARRLGGLLAAAAVALGGARGEAGAGRELHDLLERAWDFQLAEDPLFATSAGEHRHGDRLPSMTLADFDRRERFWRGVESALGRVDRSALERTDRVSHDVLSTLARDQLAELRFRTWRLPLTADSGFHVDLARLPFEAPRATVGDYESYLTRLRAVPAYFDQQIALLRVGLRTGFTMPCAVLEGYEASISGQVVSDPEGSVFAVPFRTPPAGMPPESAHRLRAAGRTAIRGSVVPAYRKFLEFMEREYVPGCRNTTGASELPDGPAYYAHRVRQYTTLDLTAEDVHRIGLEEVARIRGEMEGVVRQAGFQGDFAAFLQFLRTEPRFYARSAEDLLKEASFIAKRMDGRLPSLFRTLPRLPYGVEAVPAHLAPKYTGGRYVPAPPGGAEAGKYWVNTYALESRPLYTLEALTLHEAVPGHHLQIALAQEQTGLPPLRRFVSVDAFSEGWALYAERLGLEAGFYSDPYSNFGRLTYEMWRACRLVVDTGLHAFGWSRDRAREYLASHTALSLHEVQTETDRYISWPGQALAYKTGERKIRELRAGAEAALGPAFDLRAFHEAVLENGPVPLPVLEEQVEAYVERAAQASR